MASCFVCASLVAIQPYPDKPDGAVEYVGKDDASAPTADQIRACIASVLPELLNGSKRRQQSGVVGNDSLGHKQAVTVACSHRIFAFFIPFVSSCSNRRRATVQISVSEPSQRTKPSIASYSAKPRAS